MKITSSKRDDILKEKEKYDAQMAEYNEANKAKDKKRYLDEQAVFEPIQKYLEDNLNKFNLLNFDIRLSRGWDWSERDETVADDIEVDIKCNDTNHFDEDVALSWNYDVKILKGEVEAESSSWSGLKAVTAEQLNSLKQTVSAIEFLQSVNWKSLLYRKLPNNMTYYKDMPKRPESRNFDKELLEADVEESFGTGLGFPGILEPEYESRWNSARHGYYFFYGETPMQYRCVWVPAHYVEKGQMDDYDWKQETSRMKKEKVIRNLDKQGKRITVDSMKVK